MMERKSRPTGLPKRTAPQGKMEKSNDLKWNIL